MSKVSNQIPTEPITAVGIVASPSKVPDGYHVVAQTTDGHDADLWKDGRFKSKVTRYLCFTRNTSPNVIVDLKLIEIKDPLPEMFTLVQETMDTKEAAMRKRRLCVKMSPRGIADKAVCDIQVISRSKHHLVNYTCLGEINTMGIWYQTQEVTENPPTQDIHTDPLTSTTRGRTMTRPQYEQQNSGSYLMTALDDVPFVISDKFCEKSKKMQQVNLMGITIKSPPEIEKEFHYNFSTERSVAY